MAAQRWRACLDVDGAYSKWHVVVVSTMDIVDTGPTLWQPQSKQLCVERAERGGMGTNRSSSVYMYAHSYKSRPHF